MQFHVQTAYENFDCISSLDRIYFSLFVLEYAYSYCTLVLEEVSNKPVVSPERYGRNNTIRRRSPRQHGPLCQVLCIHNLLLHIARHHSFRTCTGMLISLWLTCFLVLVKYTYMCISTWMQRVAFTYLLLNTGDGTIALCVMNLIANVMLI